MSCKILFLISLILVIQINFISGKPKRWCNKFEGTTFDYLTLNAHHTKHYRAPTEGKCFTFGIQSQSAFYLALTENEDNLKPDNKSIISGGGIIVKVSSSDEKNAIYNYKTLEFEETGKTTPNFSYTSIYDVVHDEYAHFWLTWNNDNFKLGRQNNEEPFLDGKLPTNYNVGFIQIIKGSSELKIKMEKCKTCPDGTVIEYETVPPPDPSKCVNDMQYNAITRFNKIDNLHTAYYYTPTTGKCFTFGIKSQSEFYVALTEDQINLKPDNETIVSSGGFIAKISNSILKNAIYNYETSQFEETDKKTENFFYSEEKELNDYHVKFTDFWLSWNDDIVKLGQKGNAKSLLEGKLPENYDVGFIQLMKGSSGLRIFVEKCMSCPDGTKIVYNDYSPLFKINV